MVANSAYDIIRKAFRSGELVLSAHPDTPLNTPLGDKLLWHNKGDLLSPQYYKKILPLLKSLIAGHDLKYDYLIGSDTGGIAWASFLAQELSKTVCIVWNKKVLSFPTFYSLNLTQLESCSAVATNVLGIPMAAHCAYVMDKTLIYIKTGPSANMKLILEGNLQTDSTVCLYEVYTDDMKIRTAQHEQILNKAGLKVIHGSGVPKTEHIHLRGKRVLIVDDLYRSGNSSLEHIDFLRASGAIITDAICLFNQQTDAGKDLARKKEVHINGIFTASGIIDIASSEGIIRESEKDAYLAAITENAVVI
jgi:orotate phosphoribosyltransferase